MDDLTILIDRAATAHQALETLVASIQSSLEKDHPKILDKLGQELDGGLNNELGVFLLCAPADDLSGKSILQKYIQGADFESLLSSRLNKSEGHRP